MKISELKPIFVVSVPYVHLTQEELTGITKSLESKLEGYNILVHGNIRDEVTHNLYSVNNITEIELQELKDLVAETIKE